MEKQSARDLIVEAMKELDENSVKRYVHLAFDEGMSAQDVSDCLREGMTEVGKMFEKREYFISELIMAGTIYDEILKTLDFSSETTDGAPGCTILLGTVKGDIHDIGKNIFGSLAQSNGFRVVDLGVDIKAETFIEEIRRIRPQILGLSGVMGYAQEQMKSVIDQLRREGLRDDLKVVVGGSTFLNNSIDESIGADAYMLDAWEGLELCRKWAEERHNG